MFDILPLLNNLLKYTFCLILKNIREGRVLKNPSSNLATQESMSSDMHPNSAGPSSVFNMLEVVNIVGASSMDKAALT